MSHQHTRRRAKGRLRENSPLYSHVISLPADLIIRVESRNPKPSQGEIMALAVKALKPALDEYETVDLDAVNFLDVAVYDIKSYKAYWFDLLDTTQVTISYMLSLQSNPNLPPELRSYATEDAARNALFNYVKANYIVEVGEQIPPDKTPAELIAKFYSEVDESYEIGTVDPANEKCTHIECQNCANDPKKGLLHAATITRVN